MNEHVVPPEVIEEIEWERAYDLVYLVGLSRLVDPLGNPRAMTTFAERMALEKKRLAAKRFIARSHAACRSAPSSVVSLRRKYS